MIVLFLKTMAQLDILGLKGYSTSGTSLLVELERPHLVGKLKEEYERWCHVSYLEILSKR